MIFVENSTPIVDLDSILNMLRANLDSRFDLPTPESPIRTTEMRTHKEDVKYHDVSRIDSLLHRKLNSSLVSAIVGWRLVDTSVGRTFMAVLNHCRGLLQVVLQDNSTWRGDSTTRKNVSDKLPLIPPRHVRYQTVAKCSQIAHRTASPQSSSGSSIGYDVRGFFKRHPKLTF